MGGVFAGSTVTVHSSVTVKRESPAVRRSTYVPSIPNCAVVTAEAAFANVTVPGPETLVHVVVSVLPKGQPSSVAVPFKVAAAGRRTVWSGPALTTGGWFSGWTST